jgi:hypothetical protein
MSANGYVVTGPHPDSGVGSNLASLAGAIWCAEQLGRAVIVDWRNSAALKNKSLNYFVEFFETPPIIQGVEILYAPCATLPEMDAGDGVDIVGVSRCRASIAARSHPATFMVLRDYHALERLDPHGDPAAHFWRMKQFYERVTPRRFIADIVNAWATEHLADAFVVGVNLAEGNGEFAKGAPWEGRADVGIFADERAFLARMERARRAALSGLPRTLRQRSRMFFATDSYAMRDLLQKAPAAITRRRTFPPPGAGRAFCDYQTPGYTDRDAVVDALVDMFLLGRCHALIRNGTTFNAYAVTVNAFFNGNVQHIERFYVRYWLRAASSLLKRRLGR